MRCSSSAERRRACDASAVALRLGQVGEQSRVARRGQHGEVPHVLEQIAAEALARRSRASCSVAERAQAAPPASPASTASATVDARAGDRRRRARARTRRTSAAPSPRRRAPARAATARRAGCPRPRARRARCASSAARSSSATTRRSSRARAARRPMRREVVALAARDDRRQHLVRVGGREDELDVRRRLLERLQQRVERVLREHVHLVDDVDLEAALDRPVRDRLHQVAHLVDLVCEAPSISSTSKAMPSAISRQVEQALHGSGAGPRSQLSALARMRAVVVLPTPRGPGEEERVRDATGRDRRLQRPRDVLLADDVREALRPQPAGEHLIAHASSRRSPAPRHPTVMARVPCGTEGHSVPLLPSGPDGVRDAVLRRT